MKRVLYGGAVAALAAGLFGLSQLYLVRRHVDILREQAGDTQSSIRALNVSIFESNLYIFSAFIGIVGVGLAYLCVLYRPPGSKFMAPKFIMIVILILAVLYSLGLMILSVNHFFLNQ